jgi:hypothetical protein
MVHMHRVIINFPSFLRRWVLNDFSKRLTFVFNAMPGSQTQTTIAGSTQLSQAFLGMSYHTMSGSISVFTHCKKVKIGLTADKAVMKHP